MRSIENSGQARSIRRLTPPCFSPPPRISWLTGTIGNPRVLAADFLEGLQAYAEDLRDMVDYDVVDERLVSDGFLNSYRFLIWPAGNVAEAGTLQKVKTWVENGGTLLIAGLENIKTVEQDRGAFERSRETAGNRWSAASWQRKNHHDRRKVKDLDAIFPAELDARDGVLVSAFKEGTLFFNKTDKPVVKKVSVASVSTEITLAPFQFQWIRH